MIRGSAGLQALGAVALLLLLLTACAAIDPGLPSANADADQAVAVGATVTLDGGGSSDPAGRTLGFAWSVVSTPAGSEATVSGAAQARASVHPNRYDTTHRALEPHASAGERHDGPERVPKRREARERVHVRQ